MVKLIGIGCVLISTTLVGFHFANVLANRSKQLRQLQSALQILEAEITYGQVPLATASARIATQIQEPLALFWRSLSNKLTAGISGVSVIFREALEETWHQTVLKQEEYEIISQFGETLGKHDRYGQQQHIQIALTHLVRIEKEAVEEQRKFEKMFKSLGALSGLLIVILLV